MHRRFGQSLPKATFTVCDGTFNPNYLHGDLLVSLVHATTAVLALLVQFVALPSQC